MSLVDHSLVIRKADPDAHQQRMTRLEEALRCGAHVNTAAAYAGIVPRTLARWLEEGRRLREVLDAVEQDPEDDREPSPSELELIWLAETVDRAEAEAEVGLVRAMHQTAQPVVEEVTDHGEGEYETRRINLGLDADGVRAAGFMLERRFKDRWAKRTEATGANGGPIETEDVGVRRAHLDQVLDTIRERLEAQHQHRTLGGGDDVEVVEVSRDGGGKARGQARPTGRTDASPEPPA